MPILSRTSPLKAAALAGFVASLTATTVFAEVSSSTVKMLTANFDQRQVTQVEVGDFHFAPGQIGPLHTHAAPAVGYIVRGTIVLQVEGEDPQILREGDAFYEPAGPRILQFNNASATEEAIFVDFNIEQHGEPFIVFENPPTENIDRRTLPTFDIEDGPVSNVDISKTELAADDKTKIDNAKPVFGLIAEGIVTIVADGADPIRVVAGESFAVPEDAKDVTFANASSELPAKIITFTMY